MWSVAVLIALYISSTLAIPPQTYHIHTTDQLHALLRSKHLTLTLDPTKSTTTNAIPAPRNVPNNTLDYQDGAYTHRDTSWGKWGDTELIIRRSNFDKMNNWDNAKRNRVADEAVNAAWGLWQAWTVDGMNFQAEYDHEAGNEDKGGFTVILPGRISSDLDIKTEENMVYTYDYIPQTETFGVQTVRYSYPDNNRSIRKWLGKKDQSFSVGMTIYDGEGHMCDVDYAEFYGAIYHAAYVSMGSGLELCGFVSTCCDGGNRCESMQIQMSNSDGQGAAGDCLDINRNTRMD